MFNKFLKASVVLMPMISFHVVNGQDIHFTDVQNMSQWYNASLKQYRNSDVKLNIRDIRYQSNQAFQTGTALFNVLTSKKESEALSDAKNFGNISGALAFDKSNNGLFRNSMGLLGFSYAINLNSRGLYMAAGFQGLITNYRLGGNGTYQDQYDQYGSIQSGLSADALRLGKAYSYASLNAGWSMFQRSDKLDWYIGLSLRHVNRPFTEETKSTLYRLPMTAGIQGGLSLKSAYNRVDLFGMINRKAKAHELIGGLRYNFLLGDNSDGEGDELNQAITLGFGLLYRVKDAVIPEIQLGVGKTGLGLHYDMNMSGIRASGFTRRGFELQLTQKF